MRVFLLFLGLTCAAAPCFGGYSFSRTVTIDHTKVPNTDQADFPVLISGTYTYLKTVGNGGKVTNSSGFDIVFGTDRACTSLYNFDLETYSATTGTVNFWVRIPTLTTATDNVFYMCYGNSAVVTFQGNTNGTWVSSFKAVWHYPNGSTLSLADSTSNARNGSNGTVAPGADAGKIDGGSSSTVTNTGYSTYSSTGLPAGTANRTISAWFGPKTDLTDPHDYVMFYGTAGSNSRAQGMRVVRTAIAACAGGTGDLYVISYIGWNDDYQGTTTFCSRPQGVFHYVALTFTSSGTVARIYLDGVVDSSGSSVKGSWNTLLSASVWVNEADPSIFAGNCSCVVDEARIADTVRSADWIATEFNNQGSPSTFYTLGSETPLGGHGLLLHGVG